MPFGIGGEPDDVAEQHRHVLIALRRELGRALVELLLELAMTLLRIG
jgi:hypothetical protein